MTDSALQPAVIYCRVSTTKQATEGHGLDSQESRCREHAAAKGYVVEAVFPDDVSGGGDFMKRPGMLALLSYLDAQPDKDYVVIFDDLKRFARDTEFHIKLRRAFKARGAMVECLNFKFDDTPEGEFIETVLAAQGQLERKQNGRQVAQKMKARMQNGYWVSRAPIGYKYEKTKQHGKLLVRDEPLASIVTEALEGYAAGRFESVVEVQRFLQGQPAFTEKRKGKVHYQSVYNMLTCAIYAGSIGYANRGLRLIQGQHEPLVGPEMWKTIQDRLQGRAKAPARKDIHEDFPLRGFVTCGGCGKPMTAAWSKGRNRKYPYYVCYHNGCAQQRKSIRKEEIEGEFETLLLSLRPSPALFHTAFEMMRDLWQQRIDDAGQRSKCIKAELAQLERKSEQLMDRLIQTDSQALVSAYENQVRKLEEQKALLSEKVSNRGQPLASFADTFRTAFSFLENPQKLWASEHLEHKRLVLRMVFATRLDYVRNEGFRTAETTLPFKVLQDFSARNSKMVGDTGIEPVTFPV